MVRFCVYLPAFSAFYHRAVSVVMGDFYKELGFAGAAAIGFITAALAHGRAGGVGLGLCGLRALRVDNDHIKLRHWESRFAVCAAYLLRRAPATYKPYEDRSVSLYCPHVTLHKFQLKPPAQRCRD